jgi:2-polyprenyl-6-methoxyphenol hydroxylase-like FAD-dependent oxidoreductase
MSNTEIIQIPIAIIGAGIGGLATAHALGQQGIVAHVFEQAPGFKRIGAGIQMGPNATRVLHGFGLAEHLKQSSFEPKTNLNRVWDTGEVSNEFPLLGHASEKYGTPFYALHRGDLHAALCRLVPESQIHLGKKLISWEQESSHVLLKFEDGTLVRANAVIGADGVHSLIRDKLLGPEEPRFTGKIAYRTTYPSSRLKGVDIGQSRTKWWGVDRHIVIYYVTRQQDEIYFVTSQPEDASWTTKESWSAKGELSALRQAYAGFHPDVQAVLEACPEVYKWALYERDPLDKWCEGSVLLMGDACHPMTPYMAQGAAMALEDSVVLARVLAQAPSDEWPQAFKLFEQIRKPRTSMIQKASSANQWMQKKTNPDWVYGYNAWEVPLVPATEEFT